MHKEQQSNRCSGQIFKEGDEIAPGGKKEASNTTVIRVKGERIEDTKKFSERLSDD
ncbi:hypothetical protein ACNKHN_14030 [Shigella flexneri]